MVSGIQMMLDNDGIEQAIPLPGILKMTGWSRTKFYNKKENLEKCGVVFYRYTGRPPARRGPFAFPSELKTWIRIEASKGKLI